MVQESELIRPKFDYPRQFIEIDDLRLAYWDEGSGPALLLVHGIGSSIEYWSWLMPELTRHYRVVAFDLPGYGLSTIPKPEHTSIHNLDDTADVLHAIVQQLGLGKPFLIAHSMGTGIVLKYALKHQPAGPGMALLSPIGFGEEIDLISRLITVPVLGRLIFQPHRRIIRSFIESEFPTIGLDTLADRTYEYFQREGAINWHLHLMRQGASLSGQTTRFTRSELQALDTETLIIVGENDNLFPTTHAERAARLIPHSTLHVLPDVGHNPHVEHPTKVLELLLPVLQQHYFTVS